MARTDLLYRGCYSHVVSRSIRKLEIFKDRDDFEEFKNLLIIEKRKSQFKIYHYCLMHTHFHIAVQIEDVSDFSRSMSNIKRQYTGAFHQKYRLSGPIWRERYKSLLIENEGYMFGCGQYIEKNPVKAGLVAKAEEWEHSSARYYLKDDIDSLVDSYDDIARVKRLKVNQEMTEEDFEKGSLIGSTFFRFQFFGGRRRM